MNSVVSDASTFDTGAGVEPTDRPGLRGAWLAHRRRRAALAVLVAAAACVVYVNALANGFALDDVAIIQDNARVHDVGNLRGIWLTPYWPFFGVELGLWRPLAVFGYAVQWSLGGGAAWVFHAVDIALHVAVSVLVFVLLERLTASGPALAGALLFAVHPVHTEAVANIVGQAELIAAIALIGACIVHAYRPAGASVSWMRRLVLVLLFATALLAKEHAVVLPALLLLTDVAQRRVAVSWRGVARYIDDMLMPMLLLGCVLLGYLLARYFVLDGVLLGTEAGPQLHYLRSEYRIFNALRAFPEFLRLLVFPLELSAEYAPAMFLPVESWTAMTTVGAVLLAATVAVALLTPWHPAAGFPAGWFVIGVITVSNLLFPIGTLIAERALYLASVAFSAAVAYALFSLAPAASRQARRVATATLLVIGCAFGVRTWLRNPDWKSTNSVLYSVLRDYPQSYRAQFTHATWQWQLGRPEVAADHFELATRIYDRDSQLLTEYANYLLQHGQAVRAVELAERAFAIHPHVPRTMLVLAIAYLQTGRYADALRIADHADHTVPAAVDEYGGLSYAFTMPIRAAASDGLGQADKALGTWRYVINELELEPPIAWAALARSLAQREKTEDALRAIRRGVDAAARDSTALLRRMKNIEAAIIARCYGSNNAARAGQPAVRSKPPGYIELMYILAGATVVLSDTAGVQSGYSACRA